jgi:hypothetical protein
MLLKYTQKQRWLLNGNPFLIFRKERNSFLLESYLLWVPELLHEGIRKSWPPVLFSGNIIKPNLVLLETVHKLIAKYSKQINPE